MQCQALPTACRLLSSGRCVVSLGCLAPLPHCAAACCPAVSCCAPLHPAASGLAALGTNDEEVFEDLKNVLYTDDAVAGEAAGIAMGLLCCGSGSDKAQEMLAYAHDTQHEKIIRGLAMGLALISYGIEEAADTLVEQMAREQDPILRYGAMYVIGLAYRGTGNNAAVQKLLHYAVSDVADDVRRAAVLCLGFVLMGAPEQCPKIVALLAESFNPHVRYGAAMAVGLACAGGHQESGWWQWQWQWQPAHLLFNALTAIVV